MHGVIQFNPKAWLKPYIAMNTKLRTEAKNYFEKDFFKLMNNSISGKTMENVRKHRDINLVTTDKRRNQLLSERNYHTPKCFDGNRNGKTRVKINKPIYPKLCFMDSESFVIYIRTEDFYKDIVNDVEEWFETSNYSKDNNRPLPIGSNKKVISIFKDELGGKIMKEFVGLRAKIYSYLMDDDAEQKKAKGTKKCIIKRILTFKDYKDCLFNNKIILQSQQRFKSDHHNLFTEQINKILRSSSNDKTLQTFDKITTYPYGTNVFKV